MKIKVGIITDPNEILTRKIKERVHLDVSDDCTVGMVKREICAQRGTGTKIHHQHLTFKNTRLEDCHLLSHYGIGDGAVIFMFSTDVAKQAMSNYVASKSS